MLFNIFVIACVTCGFVYSFFSACPYASVAKTSIYSKIISFITDLALKSGNREQKTDAVLLPEHGAIRIPFRFGGLDCVIYMPYVNGLSQRGQKLILIKNDMEIEITQPAGIPYTVTPNHLAGDVQLRNRRNEVIKEFGPNEIINNYRQSR